METWREGGVVSCDQVLNGVNWKGKVRGISPMGFYMLAFFNFGATGTAHLPSMPSPRCIPSVLSYLPRAFGLCVRSISNNTVFGPWNHCVESWGCLQGVQSDMCYDEVAHSPTKSEYK